MENMVTGLAKTLGLAVLDLLLPPRCEVCHTLQTPVLCEACLQQFVAITEPWCEVCGEPFDPLAKSDALCRHCREEAPAFDAARSAGIYGGALRQAVHQLKYALTPSLAAPLGDYFARRIAAFPFAVDVLCPAPLHPQRERMRGFNQSQLLAARAGSHWGIPLDNALLERTVNSTPQMLLPREERRKNIRGAFHVCGEVRGASVAVLDDVYTTGATLRECARVLKKAGAARVLVLTLARVLPERLAIT